MSAVHALKACSASSHGSCHQTSGQALHLCATPVLEFRPFQLAATCTCSCRDDPDAKYGCGRAGRIAFWCGIVLFAVLVLHTMVVLYFRRRGRHPPEMLEFPRVELFALLLMIQPIAQSAASATLDCELEWETQHSSTESVRIVHRHVALLIGRGNQPDRLSLVRATVLYSPLQYTIPLLLGVEQM